MNANDKIRERFHFPNRLNRIIHAGGILMAGSLTENLLRFIRNIILVRLLAPEVFGLMAMVLASVAVMEAFTEVGLKQSLIQHKKGAEEGFLNIVWWMAALRGVALFLIGCLVAPMICNFYQKPELLSLIRVGFLAILLNGLISPKVHVLEKEMRFSGWVFLMQGSGALGVITTMVIAFFSQNVWALVIGHVFEAFLKSLFSFIFYPIRPRFEFDKKYASDIISFSKKMFGLPILMMLFVQTDVFVIGRILSMGELGMYALAKGLAEMPNTFLSRIVQPIVLPTLAEIQDEKAILREKMLSITEWSTVLGLPFVAFLIVFSKPFLSVIYGTDYNAVAIPFGLLSLYNFILLSSSFFMNFYIAIGQPDIHRFASFTRTALFLIVIYPAVKYFGLVGAAFSVLMSMCVLLTILVVYLKRHLQIGYSEYFKCWAKGFKMALVVIIPGCSLNLFSEPSTIHAFTVGILLCLAAWGVGIARMFQKYHKNFSGAALNKI